MEDNTSNNTETPNVQSTNTSNTGGIKKWQVNTIIILGLLLLITLGLIFYVLAFKKPSNNTVASLKTATKKTNTVVNPYKGWLTYTNPTYGYSFKYPSNWNINTTYALHPQQPAPGFATNESMITLKSLLGNTNSVTFIYNGGIDFSLQPGGYLSRTQKINVLNRTYYVSYINAGQNCTITPTRDISQLPLSCSKEFNQIFISNNLPTLSTIESAPYPQYAYATLTINNKPAIMMDYLSGETNTSAIGSNNNVLSFLKIVKSIKF
ncbi:MAG: hypothetical protein ACYDBX_03925 [Patescibacteria group bacterium]